MGDQKNEYSDRNYLLTFDLGAKIKLFRYVGLKTPNSDDPFFKDLKSEMVQKVKSAMPDVKVIAIDMEDLADEILAKALEKKSLLKDAVVVSSCLEIALPRRGYVIEVNRIINEKGEIVGLGPRPGCPTIDEQIEGLKVLAGNQPLILMEDGSFTGGTLSYLLKKLKERQLAIAAMVIGFVFPQALERIQKEFEGGIIIVEKVDSLIDWIPDHDFVPFTPNCGRVFGISINGQAYPFYTHNGASYSVPYLYPFTPMMDEWTSIPKEKNNSFSLFCLQQTITLFERLEKMNAREIRIGELLEVRPRVSVPISIGQNIFPRLDARVTSFLQETCHELS